MSDTGIYRAISAEVDKMREKVADHDINLAVMASKYLDIERGIHEIKQQVKDLADVVDELKTSTMESKIKLGLIIGIASFGAQFLTSGVMNLFGK